MQFTTAVLAILLFGFHQPALAQQVTPGTILADPLSTATLDFRNWPVGEPLSAERLANANVRSITAVTTPDYCDDAVIARKDTRAVRTPFPLLGTSRPEAPGCSTVPVRVELTKEAVAVRVYFYGAAVPYSLRVNTTAGKRTVQASGSPGYDYSAPSLVEWQSTGETARSFEFGRVMALTLIERIEIDFERENVQAPFKLRLLFPEEQSGDQWSGRDPTAYFEHIGWNWNVGPWGPLENNTSASVMPLPWDPANHIGVSVGNLQPDEFGVVMSPSRGWRLYQRRTTCADYGAAEPCAASLLGYFVLYNIHTATMRLFVYVSPSEGNVPSSYALARTSLLEIEAGERASDHPLFANDAAIASALDDASERLAYLNTDRETVAPGIAGRWLILDYDVSYVPGTVPPNLSFETVLWSVVRSDLSLSGNLQIGQPNNTAPVETNLLMQVVGLARGVAGSWSASAKDFNDLAAQLEKTADAWEQQQQLQSMQDTFRNAANLATTVLGPMAGLAQAGIALVEGIAGFHSKSEGSAAMIYSEGMLELEGEITTQDDRVDLVFGLHGAPHNDARNEADFEFDGNLGLFSLDRRPIVYLGDDFIQIEPIRPLININPASDMELVEVLYQPIVEIPRSEVPRTRFFGLEGDDEVIARLKAGEGDLQALWASLGAPFDTNFYDNAGQFQDPDAEGALYRGFFRTMDQPLDESETVNVRFDPDAGFLSLDVPEVRVSGASTHLNASRPPSVYVRLFFRFHHRTLKKPDGRPLVTAEFQRIYAADLQREPCRRGTTANDPRVYFRFACDAGGPGGGTITLIERKIMPQLSRIRTCGTDQSDKWAEVYTLPDYQSAVRYSEGDGDDCSYFFEVLHSKLDAQSSVPDLADAHLTANPRATEGPAVVSSGGAMLLAYPDRNRQIRVFRSVNGALWNRVILPETTDHAPALGYFQGRFYLAWTGRDSEGSLNVMSSADGLSWRNKHVFRGSSGQRARSRSGPALAASDSRMLIAWRGTNNGSPYIRTMETVNGVTWGNKRRTNETTNHAPALLHFNNRFHLAWTGRDDQRSLNIMSSSNGASWGSKHVFRGSAAQSARSRSGPALATDGTRIILAWRGTNNSTPHIRFFQSTNGTSWSNKTRSPFQTEDSPALVHFRGNFGLAWREDDGAHLNWRTSPNLHQWEEPSLLRMGNRKSNLGVIRSLRIGGGATVDVFSGKNYTGQRERFSESVDDLPDVLDFEVRSIRVLERQ
jgi:hypothetical protein